MPFPAQASAPVCRPLYLPICIYLSNNVTFLRQKLWERISCCEKFGNQSNFTVKISSLKVKKFYVIWENNTKIDATGNEQYFFSKIEQMY